MLKEERGALAIRILMLWAFLSATTLSYIYGTMAVATLEQFRTITIVAIGAYVVIIAASMGDIYLEYGEKWKLPHIAKALQLHQTYKEWRIEYDRQNAPDALIAMR